MTTRTRQSLVLPGQAAAGLAPAEPEVLSIDQAALLQRLDALKAAPSLDLVREGVVRLRQSLTGAEPALILTANEREGASGTVELGQAYLLAELAQVADSLTLERAVYYLNRLQKALTKVRTSRINDINLNRWKEYGDIDTNSLWIVDRRDRSGVHRANYWGNFIPQIPNQMLRRYTKKGEWVLDPFAGSGTTLVESQRLGRNCLGIELQPEIASYSQDLIVQELNPFEVTSRIAVGDSTSLDYTRLLAEAGQSAVQLVIMHPPYFDIIKFSDDPHDLSNAASLEAFLAGVGRVVERAGAVLERGRYLVLVIGDKFSKGEWIPLGFQTMNEVLKHDFLLKSIVVKNFEETTGKRNQRELWHYRALVGGFYVFKHEYVFVFKKK